MKIKPNGEMELMVVLHEGRKRQIRMMMKEVGAHVVKLHREQYGSLALGNLKPGEKRLLSKQEINDLKQLVSP
ncbi:MAG: hypothetical protein HY582_04005 [Candidatus Omnitrophica bacterium]|nr:hypothetical protein [Candidatus Omnitrophota bacterium]